MRTLNKNCKQMINMLKKIELRGTALMLLLLAGCLISTACQRVIDVDLNSSSPRYVIQADILADTNLSRVMISRTRNFSDDNAFEKVSMALVILTDSEGNIDTLREAEPGTYRSTRLRGVVGRTYTLMVDVKGQRFSSISTLNRAVPFEALQVDSIAFFGQQNYLLIPRFQDPINERNNYRFIITHKDTVSEEIIVRNDAYSDGVINKRPLNTRIDFEHGDTVLVEMQTIDENVYSYFISLAQLSRGQNQSTPVNPVSNISNGALGYFSAHTTQRLKAVIP